MIVFLAAIFTYFLLKIILPFLINNFADKPNHRSSHKYSVPSGGGIGFVIVGTTGMALLGNFSAILCVPLALIGFWDDKVSLNARFRYIAQLITAIFLIFFSPIGIQIYQTINSILLITLLVNYLFVSTAIINFINFMDGLDGLVGSCMVIIISFYCITVDITFLPLVGALLGFLILNCPPAKVFMGDVGSTFLGAILVSCFLNTKSIEISLALLFISMPLLLDSSVCVVRRFFDGQKIFEAHSLHLFQRLHKAGWSHLKVTSIYIIFTTLISLTYLFFGLVSASIIVFATIYFGVWVDKKYAIPFKN